MADGLQGQSSQNESSQKGVSIYTKDNQSLSSFGAFIVRSNGGRDRSSQQIILTVLGTFGSAIIMVGVCIGGFVLVELCKQDRGDLLNVGRPANRVTPVVGRKTNF